MDLRRRTVLQGLVQVGVVKSLLAGGLLTPSVVLANDISRGAFEAHQVLDALKALGANQALPSKEIIIKAPEIAENGANVPLDVLSMIPGTNQISVLVDKNPQPLVLQLNFSQGVAPQFHARIKMAQTSNVRVVVKAGDKTYVLLREIKVTVGGCAA